LRKFGSEFSRKRDWFLPVEADFDYFAGSPSGKPLPRCGSRIDPERSQIIETIARPGESNPCFRPERANNQMKA